MHREGERPVGCCIRHYLGLEVITDIQGSQFLNQLDCTLCFQQCLLHLAHHAQGKGENLWGAASVTI